MRERELTRWHEWMDQAAKGNWPCLPSPPDERDWPLSRILEPVPIPPSVRLDHLIPFVPNQGHCGSCVGKAGKNVLNSYFTYKGSLPPAGLSALYIYARCKAEDGIPHLEGTYPRVALKIMQQEGSCPEADLPYSQLLANCLKFPAVTAAHRAAAEPFRIKAYARLWSLDEVKQALAAGKLVLAGVWVTASFMRWDGKGVIGKPDGQVYGGHAVMFCGYDDQVGALRGVNSWGTQWGDRGFFWLSYQFCRWQSLDLGGLPALMEAWAVEIDGLPTPTKPDGKIVMWIDKPTALVGGIEVPIDPNNPKVAPRILEQRTMTPARFVAEALGARVDYFVEDKRVEITPKEGG